MELSSSALQTGDFGLTCVVFLIDVYIKLGADHGYGGWSLGTWFKLEESRGELSRSLVPKAMVFKGNSRC